MDCLPLSRILALCSGEKKGEDQKLNGVREIARKRARRPREGGRKGKKREYKKSPSNILVGANLQCVFIFIFSLLREFAAHCYSYTNSFNINPKSTSSLTSPKKNTV